VAGGLWLAQLSAAPWLFSSLFVPLAEMISIIIPTLNEEGQIGDCIQGVLAEDADCEIIVTDGGSTDQTVSLAKEFAEVNVVHSSGGRGTQMNRGALSAKGDILLFLHADTRLEKGWSVAVVAALHTNAFAGGAFTLSIESAGSQFRIIERWVKARCLVFRLPYGDQGIFVRREVFDNIGGYRDIPLMEDVDLVGKMRRAGDIIVLPVKAFTSARRWSRQGWVKVSLMNQLLLLLFRLGVNPGTLARLYYDR
jgi:rSAM/selenodomain-associated transferase 2